MKKLESNFTQIPNSILFSGNHTHAVIWGIIRHFETMDKGICKCSRTTIAELAKISESRLSRYLAEMKKSGLLDIKYTSGGKSQYITKCNQSEQIPGDDTNIKKSTQSENLPRTNNDSIAKNSNTTKNDSGVLPEIAREYCRNQQGSIAGNSKGVLPEIATLNNIDINNIENNNIHNHNHNHNLEQERAGALSSIVSSFKNDDFIFSDYLHMFGNNIHPWSKCAPDRLYHYAKKKGYCMTLSEIYKFLLIIAAGAYYKDGIPVIVNNYDTLLEKWKNKQSEAGKKFSEENNLESVTYQHNKTAEENNIPLQTVKIPYCDKGILEIRRYKPILEEKEISKYSGDYLEEIDFYPDGKKEKIERWKPGF